MCSIRISNPRQNTDFSRKSRNNRNAVALRYIHAVALISILVVFTLLSGVKAIAEDDIQIYDIEKYNESVPDEAKEYIDENSEFTF